MLPLPLTDESESVAFMHSSFVVVSSVCSSSTVKGEDHSFLHLWTHMKLPLPMMLSFAAYAIVVQSFLRHYYCCPQLRPSLLSSKAFSIVVVAVCSFLRRRHCGIATFEGSSLTPFPSSLSTVGDSFLPS
ncbi:hypothetical protein GW17_00024115 [Ensete ventricosum]|nr:hypothetical protein GW17_00024115 [Ensete ventricosum]RZR98077.1 hypothetical protein BHM03_00027382 [Ensete ventricosum]